MSGKPNGHRARGAVADDVSVISSSSDEGFYLLVGFCLLGHSPGPDGGSGRLAP